jgi:predicted CopG family antitoxin
MNSRNTITIRNQVYERLKRHGAFGESFSKLITRILDELERGKNEIDA